MIAKPLILQGGVNEVFHINKWHVSIRVS
jgi:hypothetical protein